MGYTTEFKGKFDLDKPLDEDTYKLLKGLSETRRMKRDVEDKFGVEGEFYINLDGDFGQTHENNIVDYNEPPKTQPSLWLQWIPTEDKLHIEWNGAEKFYEYIKWIKYIIDKILIPRGYVLNGEVRWRGEEFDDMGTIVVEDNVLITN